jgi:hypothetical protein
VRRVRRQAAETNAQVTDEAFQLDESPAASQDLDSTPSSAHSQGGNGTSTVVREHPWDGHRPTQTFCIWDISCHDSPSPVTKRLSFTSNDGENGGLTHLQTYASQVLLHLTVVFEFSRLNLPCLEI